MNSLIIFLYKKKYGNIDSIEQYFESLGLVKYEKPASKTTWSTSNTWHYSSGTDTVIGWKINLLDGYYDSILTSKRLNTLLNMGYTTFHNMTELDSVEIKKIIKTSNIAKSFGV